MPVSSMLERLKQQLYPLVQQNAVSDAMLVGPASALAVLDGSLDMILAGGRYLERGNVTIPVGLDTLIQVPEVDRLDENGLPVYAALVDWTEMFRVGDEVIVGGSALGNNTRRTITAVTEQLNGQSEVIGYTLTVSEPFEAPETGLVYGKPTFALRQLCRELLLYPGGYETDTQLRTLLSSWLTTMQRRGTRAGIVADVNRLTNSTGTELLETGVPLTEIGTGLSYTHSTRAVTVTSESVAIGDSVTVSQSVEDSDGRYTVYTNTGTTLVLGHRAAESRFYRAVTEPNVLELQVREDRVTNTVWVRLINTSDSSGSVTFTLTVAGGTFSGAWLATGTGTVGSTSSVATITLTVGAASVSSPVVSEAAVALVSPTAATQLTLDVTAGTPTQVRLGLLSLGDRAPGGAPILDPLNPWRWGGVVRTGLRSGLNETGLTLHAQTTPGWFVGISSPDSVEEDAYTMASPDEFVVIETDHRNPANYSEQDLVRLVRDVLLPADVDGALRLT